MTFFLSLETVSNTSLCLTAAVYSMSPSDFLASSDSNQLLQLFPVAWLFPVLYPEFNIETWMSLSRPSPGTGIEACTKCADGYILEDWRCVSTCSSGYYLSEQTSDSGQVQRSCKKWVSTTTHKATTPFVLRVDITWPLYNNQQLYQGRKHLHRALLVWKPTQ